MSGNNPHDRDALLVKLSALLDGELPETEQNQLFDAMSQDPALLLAFEALAATRAAFSPLPHTDAAAVTAAVMAVVDPDTVPASTAGTLALTSAALDGEPIAAQVFDAALDVEGAATEVLSFVEANELVRAGGSALAQAPSTKSALAPVAERIDATLASIERAGVLSMAHADAALSAGEQSELSGLWERLDPASLRLPQSSAFVREALASARDSTPFIVHARRAGDAAVQAVEALTRIREAERVPVVEAPPQPSFFARLWQSMSVARLPLALAGASAALFFALRPPGPDPSAANSRELVAQALVDALAPAVLSDSPRPSDLPLLADNEADVEALDAHGTTMVFSTQESNITVIWVSGDDDDGEEQGT